MLTVLVQGIHILNLNFFLLSAIHIHINNIIMHNIAGVLANYLSYIVWRAVRMLASMLLMMEPASVIDFLECTQLTGTKRVKLLMKNLILSQPEEFIIFYFVPNASHLQ